jgi:cellulose synthase/poly-beta-1,6-N-acetylglucosamine synthase-like glycosyltransferase
LPLFEYGYTAVQGKIEPSNRTFNSITRLLGLESDLFSYPYMIVRDFLSKRTPLGGTGFVIKKDILVKEGKFDNGLIDDFQLSFKLYRKGYKVGFAPLSVVYDEKPPNFDLLFRQRSRWVKGHIDLLSKKVPEIKDIMGIIYWLSPVSMVAGFLLLSLTSFGIIHLLTMGYYPYTFTFMPVTIWLLTVAVSYFLQIYILTCTLGKRTIRDVLQTAVLIPFSHYWYVVLIKSFFVKSWANTKTPHGFDNSLKVQAQAQTSKVQSAREEYANIKTGYEKGHANI